MKQTHRHPWLPYFMISLALLFIIYAYVIQVTPSIMINEIMRDFNIGAKGIGILGSSFLFAYAIMQVPAGMLLDRFGARWMLTVAALISGLGALLFSTSHSLLLGSSARILVGASSSFSFLGGVYIAYRWLKPSQFALAVGALQLGSGIGAIMGEAPLARLFHSMSWRTGFIMIAAFAFVLMIAFALFIRDLPADSPHSQRTTQHLTPTLKTGQLWALASINFITWMPAGAVGGLWGIPYLIHAKHWSNTEAGAVFIALWATVSFMAPVIGAVADKVTHPKKIMLLSLILGLIGSLVLLWASALPTILIVMMLLLLGIPAASQCVAFSMLRFHVPAHHYSVSSAICNMATVGGGALGQMMMGYLIAWHATKNPAMTMATYTTHNYLTGMIFIPVMLLIGVVIASVFVKNVNTS